MARFLVKYADDGGEPAGMEVEVGRGEGPEEAAAAARRELADGRPSVAEDEWNILSAERIEPAPRVDSLARWLSEQFSGGVMSVSVEDVMDDGMTVSGEIEAVIDEYAAGGQERPPVVDAFEVMGDVWAGGYDLASGEDFVTDDETVADIVNAHVAELEGRPKP